MALISTHGLTNPHHWGSKLDGW